MFIEVTLIETQEVLNVTGKADSGVLRFVKETLRFIPLSRLDFIRPSEEGLSYVDQDGNPTKFDDAGGAKFVAKSELCYCVQIDGKPLMVNESYASLTNRIRQLAGMPVQQSTQAVVNAPPASVPPAAQANISQMPLATGLGTVGTL